MKIDKFFKLLPKIALLLTFSALSVFSATNEQDNPAVQQGPRLNLITLRDSLTEIIRENEELPVVRQTLIERNTTIGELTEDLKTVKDLNKDLIKQNEELPTLRDKLTALAGPVEESPKVLVLG